MTTRSAEELLDRLHDDPDFAAEVHRLAGDPAALGAHLSAAGFEVSNEEARDAFLERYGSQLSAEQLEAISSGNFLSDFVGLAAGWFSTVGTAIADAATGVYGAIAGAITGTDPTH